VPFSAISAGRPLRTLRQELFSFLKIKALNLRVRGENPQRTRRKTLRPAQSTTKRGTNCKSLWREPPSYFSFALQSKTTDMGDVADFGCVLMRNFCPSLVTS
jgi:hypothetical protein